MTIRSLPVRETLDHLLAQARGDGLRAHLVRGAAGGFALKVANTGLTFTTGVLLARALGADGYGIYAFAMAIVALLEVPSQLGMPTLVVRLAAAYRVKDDWAPLRGLLRRSGQAVFAFSILLVTWLGAGIWLFGGRYPPETVATFAWALALVPLVALGALRGAALRGLRHIVLGQVPDTLVRPVVFLLLLGFTHWALGWTLRPSTAMALQVCAVGVAFALGAWWLWRRLPSPLKAVTPTYESRRWARSAFPLMLVGGIGVIQTHVDILMLGLFRTPEEVGVYRVAVLAATIVLFAMVVINAAIAPTLSQLHAQGSHRRLQQVVTWSAQIGFFLFALPSTLLLIVFGGAILGTIFGYPFAAGHVPLAVLCVGQLANAAAGPALLLMNMTGYERDAARSIGVAMVLNVLLNLLLIPQFGGSGAAAATTATLLVRNVLLAWGVYRRLGIRPMAFVNPSGVRLES